MDSYFVEIQRPFMPPSDDARLVLIADGSLHRARRRMGLPPLR